MRSCPPTPAGAAVRRPPLLKPFALLWLMAVLGGLAALPLRAVEPGEIFEFGYSPIKPPPAGLDRVIAVAPAQDHVLALREDGTVVAWGDNFFDQVAVPAGLKRVTAIAAAARHNLALQEDGTVAAWGDNYYSQTNVPQGLNRVTAIAAQLNYNLALREDGTVVGWGTNLLRQVPTQIPAGLSGVTAIAAGATHALALKADGTVVGWGSNDSGETTIPPTLRGVKAIAAGEQFSMAVRTNGSVAVWGYYALGADQIPKAWSRVVAIAAGGYSSIGLKADGSVVAWDVFDINVTQTPPGLSGVTAVAVDSFSGNYTVVVIPAAPKIVLQPASQAVPVGKDYVFFNVAASGYPQKYQWRRDGVDLVGENGRSLLLASLQTNHAGSYTVEVSNSQGRVISNPATLTVNRKPQTITFDPVTGPQPGRPGDPPVTLSARASSGLPVTFASSDPRVAEVNGGVLTFVGVGTADLIARQPGDATWSPALDRRQTVTSTVPTVVVTWGGYGYVPLPAGLNRVTTIAQGQSHYVGLKEDGTVVAWGNGFEGQTNVPAGLNRVIAIAAGANHSLALKEDGTVVAWGVSFSGEASIPANLRKATAIVAADNLSLVLQDDGTVVAWGANYSGQTNVPAGLSGVTAIAAGGSYCLALKEDGTVVAWGWNGSGQTNVPAGLSGVTAIAAGTFHCLALKEDGTVVGWGDDSLRQLRIPPGLSGVKAIAAGFSFSLALKEDGTVVAWGYSQSGANKVPVGLERVMAIATGQDSGLAFVRPVVPEITTQPVSRTVLARENVVFSVTATGYPVSYQWRRDGADIPGATNVTLGLGDLTTGRAGNYSVEVSNVAGRVTSEAAVLTVNRLAQAITFGPLPGRQPGDAPFELSATADSGLPVRFTSGDPQVATVTGSTVTLVRAGTVELIANQDGDETYLPASEVRQTLSVTSPLAEFRLTAATATVREDGPVLVVTVLRSPPGAGTVDFATAELTARERRDYVPGADRLTFAAGQGTNTITIPIPNNFVPDEPRAFVLRLSNPDASGALGQPAAVEVTILDDDAGRTTVSAPVLTPSAERPTERSQLRVELTPADPAGLNRFGWRFAWETAWRPGSQTVPDLDAGTYELAFRPAVGFDAPSPVTNVLAPGAATPGALFVRTYPYQANAAAVGGSLQVRWEPPELTVGGWRLLGDTAYRTNGETVPGIPAGLQIVEFRPVPDFATPPAREVQVNPSATASVSVAYLYAPVPEDPAKPVALTSYQAIRNGPSLSSARPYPLVGQLRTETGYGSGIAVLERVVLTAAHVLLDDTGTNFVDRLDWFPERQAGRYEPHPLRARGWYVSTNYLAARRREAALHLRPGESTLDSQQWDVAAVYFDGPAARGGASGYLMSDEDDNPWLGLAGTSLESMLLGYPLGVGDGGNDGKMHFVSPDLYGYFRPPGSQSGNRVFGSPDFASYPGNSGGPLCVRHPNNAYYPAAVYLGSSGGQSLVRAIDRDVVSLILRAASTAAVGEDFLGGGVMRVGTSGAGFGSFQLQRLTVNLLPAGAGAGATWTLADTAQSYPSGGSLRLPAPGSYLVRFTPVPGYQTPADLSVTLTVGQDTVVTSTYEPEAAAPPPVLGVTPAGALIVSGELGGTVRLDSRADLASGTQWQPVKTVTLTESPLILLPAGFASGQAAFYRAVRVP